MRIEANENGAAVDATTEELGQVADAMGIGISAEVPADIQDQAVEQATSLATAETPVVGEAGPPIAAAGSKFLSKNISKMMKGFYRDQTEAHDIHTPVKGGRTDETVATIYDQGLTPKYPGKDTGGIPAPEGAPQTEMVPAPQATPPPRVESPMDKMSDDEILDLLNNSTFTADGDSETHVMNFTTLDDEEIAKSMNTLADVNRRAINSQRRGEITVEETALAARLLNTDPEFLKEMMNMQAGTALPAEKILALGQTVQLLLKDINVLSSKALDDPEAGKAAVKYINAYNKIYQSFMGARAEQGRGLNILQHLNKDADNRAVKLAAMMQQKEHGLTDESIIRVLAAAETPEQVAKSIEAARPSLYEMTADSLIEMRMNGMLSGVRTHVTNFVSSVVRTSADVGDTALAAFFNKNDPHLDKIAAGEWKAKMYGLTYSQHFAWEAAKRAWKTGEKYGNVDKLDDVEYAPKISAMAYGLEVDPVTGQAATKTGKFVDRLGAIIRSPTQKLMGATDAYNKYMAEQSSLAGQAFSRTANAKAKNPDIDDEAMLLDLMNNPTEEMKVTATQDGETMTFQEELVNGPVKDLQKAISGNRAAKLTIPFYKTPVNLMRQGFMERTALGILSDSYKANLKAGGRRAQLAKSKMLSGNIAASGLFYAAINGGITGHYSHDKQIRDAQIASGMEEMSIKIPRDDGTTTYIPISKLEPFTYIFGMAADLGAMFQDGQLRELTETQTEIWNGMVSTFILALADNSLNVSFMTGAKDTIDATQGGYKAENYAKRFGASMVPFSGLLRNVSDTIDPTRRKPEGITDYWLNSMTLWNKDAAPSIDSLGRTRVKENVFLSNLPITKETNPVALEMMRVSKLTGSALVPAAKTSLGGVQLTPKQQGTWMELARKDSDFMDKATDIISSQDYKDMYITDQIKIMNDLTNIYDGSFSKPSAASVRLLELYPELERKIRLLSNAPIAQRIGISEGRDPKEVLDGMMLDQGMEGVE